MAGNRRQRAANDMVEGQPRGHDNDATPMNSSECISELGSAFIDAVKASRRFAWMGIAEVSEPDSVIPRSAVYLLERPNPELETCNQAPQDVDILPAYRALAVAMRPWSRLGLYFVDGEKCNPSSLKQSFEQRAAKGGKRVTLIEEIDFEG